MVEYCRKKGTKWTAQEISRLRELAEQNTPARIIGLLLGRTEAAVRVRAWEEKIPLKIAKHQSICLLDKKKLEETFLWLS